MRKLLFASAVLVSVVAIAAATQACSVVRTVTNRSEFWQKGDTSVTIQTKTVEQYDATKRL